MTLFPPIAHAPQSQQHWGVFTQFQKGWTITCPSLRSIPIDATPSGFIRDLWVGQRRRVQELFADRLDSWAAEIRRLIASPRPFAPGLIWLNPVNEEELFDWCSSAFPERTRSERVSMANRDRVFHDWVWRRWPASDPSVPTGRILLDRRAFDE